MTKRVLVITTCTSRKKWSPESQLLQHDFQNPVHLSKRERELNSYMTTAGEMYTGRQHLALMNGVKKYRQHTSSLDVVILSEGYGVLHENDLIVPYEVSLKEMKMKKKELLTWSIHLQITSKLQEVVAQYDLVFFLVGKEYLKAIEWPLQVRPDQKLIFFGSESSKPYLKKQPQHYLLQSGKAEAKQFRQGLIEIKGFLFAKLLEHFVRETDSSWDEVYEQPQRIREMILREIHATGETTATETVTLLPFLPATS